MIFANINETINFMVQYNSHNKKNHRLYRINSDVYLRNCMNRIISLLLLL